MGTQSLYQSLVVQPILDVSIPSAVDGLRKLKQEASVAEATAVTTPEELIYAVLGGAQHIVVQKHLDLTATQPLSAVSLLNQNREGITDFGRSIQVRMLSDFKLSVILRLWPQYTCYKKFETNNIVVSNNVLSIKFVTRR